MISPNEYNWSSYHGQTSGNRTNFEFVYNETNNDYDIILSNKGKLVQYEPLLLSRKIIDDMKFYNNNNKIGTGIRAVFEININSDIYINLNAYYQSINLSFSSQSKPFYLDNINFKYHGKWNHICILVFPQSLTTGNKIVYEFSNNVL